MCMKQTKRLASLIQQTQWVKSNQENPLQDVRLCNPYIRGNAGMTLSSEGLLVAKSYVNLCNLDFYV